MEDDFDVGAAVDEIGSGLGFGEETPAGDDDVVLDVVAKDAPEVAVAEEKPAEEPTAVDTAKPAAAVDEAPKTWRKEASATWAALPSEAKAEILKREADIFAGIESYKVDATFGKSVKQVVAPFEGILRQNNMDPVQTINGLLNSHYALATGTPEQKANLFRLLARDYQIDIAALAGVQQTASGEPPYVDPAVADLRQKLAGVESELTQARQARLNESKANISRQVAGFAEDPKNIYFNELSEDMASLVQRGVAGTLQEAYEKAIWLNPVTRAKEAARIATEQAATALAAGRARTANARAALAANVKTSAKNGSATTPLSSLDDTLSEALASIKSRGG